MRRTVAILGAGGWGGNWTERALRDKDVEPVAFADANPAVLDALAARGVPRERLFADAEEAMQGVPSDAVTVSVPNPLRVPLLLLALEEGRHVLVDKPLVHTADALDSLLAAGRNRRSVFMVAQNYRLFAGVQRIKAHLESTGSVPRAMHAHFLRDPGVWQGKFVGRLPGALGLGMEMCIHHLDMMRFLIGAEAETVTAHGWSAPWTGLSGYQGLQFHIAFNNGARVAYDASNAATTSRTDWCGHWEILTDESTISYGATGRSLRIHDAEGAETLADPGPSEPADVGQSMDAVWARFKSAMADVEAGASPLDTFCPLEDNARSVALMLAAERSLAQGGASRAGE